MDIRHRKEWGAPAHATGCSPWNPAALAGFCIHWWGSPRAPSSQAGMPALLRSIRADHMGPGGLGVPDGGCDIAYNWIVDLWGAAWEGRGWNTRTGANGNTQANSTHLAICVAMGTGDTLTAAAKRTVNALIAEGRSRGIGSQIKRHHDFTGSECPGAEITAWLATGRVTNGEEDDLPEPKDIWRYEVPGGGGSEPQRAQVHLRYQSNALRVLLARTKGGASDDVDEQAIVQAVLEGLSPTTIAAAVAEALPPDLARRVVDELTERLAA